MSDLPSVDRVRLLCTDVVHSGVATGLRGCGPHRAALARGGKGVENAEN